MFQRMYKMFSFNFQTFYYSFSKRTRVNFALISRQSEYLYFISSESEVKNPTKKSSGVSSGERAG